MPDQQKYPLGALAHQYTGKEVTLASLRPPVQVAAAIVLPCKISLRDKQSAVFMQNWGTCVIATERSDMEAIEIELTGNYTSKSIKFGYKFAKEIDGIPNDSGTYPWTAKVIRMGLGLPNEALVPDTAGTSEEEYKNVDPVRQAYYNQDLLLGATWLPTDEEKKEFLAKSKGRGFACTIPVFSNYLALDSNFNVSRPDGEVLPRFGLHRVYCIGYDDDKQRWECKNSWGTGYGDGGYFYVPYSYGLMDEIGSTEPVSAAVGAVPLNLAYPVDLPFVVTQPFGANPSYYSQFGLPGHEGNDIRAKIGAQIYSVDAGSVIWAANLGSYGKCVKVRHSWGITWYCHLNGFNVSAGAQVTKKYLLGEADHTGNVIAGADHLHLNGQINGVSNPPYGGLIDILPYLKGDIMLPIEGFAVHSSKPGEELYYSKIVKWEGALELARMFKVDSTKIGKLSDFGSSPRKGFVFGNDGKLVAFYYKISSQDEKKLISDLTGIAIGSPIQSFDQL